MSEPESEHTPDGRFPQRFARLLTGLVIFGVAIVAMVRADLGLSAWDVLHQGISNRTGIAFGTVGILTGLVVLLLWLPLHERLGVGTLCNVILVGLVIDIVLPIWPENRHLAVRVPLLLVSPLVLAIGGALYLSAQLGPGPRDGLMTGLARRGWSVRLARTVIEATVLAIGWALGGGVGVGTVFLTFSIGPLIHVALVRMRVNYEAVEPRSP